MTTQQPTSEQVMQWYNNAAKLKTGEFTETLDLASFAALARADPEATIKEQTAEIERLNGRIFTLEQCREANRNDLASAQLRNEQLLDVIRFALNDSPIIRDKLSAALSTQPDLSALEAERQRVAEACARYVRSNGIGFADDDEELTHISANLEAGQWKDYYK